MKTKELSVFTIQYVANYSGLTPFLIRAWEKRYGICKPVRSKGNQRRYSQADLIRLFYLKLLTDEGHSISSVAKLSIDDLKGLSIKKIAPHLTSTKEAFEQISNIQFIIEALKGFNLHVLDHEIKKSIANQDSRSLVFSILLPAMRTVGNLVFEEKLDVAQEHAISSVFKFNLYPLISNNIAQSQDKEDSVILCTPEDELHEFGILATALLCSHYNKRVYYLGVDLPAKSIVYAQRALSSRLVIIGISDYLMRRKWDARNFLKQLEAIPPHVDIILGGKKSGQKYFERVLEIDSLEEVDKYLKKSSA